MSDIPSPRPPAVSADDDNESPPQMTLSDIDDIRTGVNELAGSDRLDKDSALSMTRLFHALETLMRDECTIRDAKISKMESEIERSRIQHELDRIANVQIHQHNNTMESTPLRRSRSKW